MFTFAVTLNTLIFLALLLYKDTMLKWAVQQGLKPSQCTISVLRGKRYKLVLFCKDIPPLLFDLLEDPKETINLAFKDDPKCSHIIAKMTKKILDWRIQYANAATRSMSKLKIVKDGEITHIRSRI